MKDSIGTEKEEKDALKPNKSIRKKRRNKKKNVAPDLNVSNAVMNIMEAFAWKLFHSICDEAAALARRKNKKTLQDMEMEAATRLVLSRNRAQRAIDKAQAAVATYFERGNIAGRAPDCDS